MSINYSLLAENTRRRLNPDNISLTKAFSNELSTISYSDVLIYVRTAMKGVEAEYTQKSIDAGDKVKAHLQNGINNISFSYQGSVMTNTHIKGYSDIDLLTIIEKFYTRDLSNISNVLNSTTIRSQYSLNSISKLEKEISLPTYSGNPIDDLRELRILCENILNEKYTNSDIDKPKSIKIKNANLNRDVDVVIANWYDDIKSILNDKVDYRGIQVYDKENNCRGKCDYPFISIKRINDRSVETNGRLKKMIRFLKNNKSNSNQEIKLSSFDINAICYDIEISQYRDVQFYELVKVLYNQLSSIFTNSNHANAILSVDGNESIFLTNSLKLIELKKLLTEVEAIYTDLILTFRK